MTIEARRVARIDFTASDLAATLAFYEALGFKPGGIVPVDGVELALLGVTDARAERLTMRLGAQEVSFLRFDPPGRPYPEGSTSTDLWFQHIAIAVSDMPDAHARALAAGARPITLDGPQTLPKTTGGVTAFKFRDPDGHPLELLFLPEGNSAAPWPAEGADVPFLGIDHTALAVGDAAGVQAFLAGLGLNSVDVTENRGVGQQRLDDVAADRCRVVPMKPPEAPPHVELLAYETGTRRPMPDGTRADDIWSTRVFIEVAATSGDGLPGVVALPGGNRAALMHDPDGHAFVLVEPGEPE